MAYPQTDDPAYPQVVTGQAVVEPRVLDADEQAEVDLMYETLKPEATEAARNYVLSRTPAKYQEAMIAKIDADWPVPIL